MSQDRPVRASLPDVLLERLAHGDLPPEAEQRIRALLRDEPGGEARLAAIEASNREILAQLPPAQLAAEVKRRLDRASAAQASRTKTWTWVLPGLAVGAAALVLLAGGMRRGQPGGSAIATSEGESEILREKGHKHPHLAVFRKQDDHADRLGAGAAVHAGDVLQLAYFSAARPFGVIVSIDARGTITPHLPTAPGSAVRLAESGETLLPNSYELDNSPGFERFVLVTGDAPFATAVVNEALRPGGAALPPNLSMVDLTLRKETP